MQYLLAVGRVQSAPMYADQDASPMAVWGYFWYALFLIWGISLGTAAYYGEKFVSRINQIVSLNNACISFVGHFW